MIVPIEVSFGLELVRLTEVRHHALILAAQ